MTPDSTNSEGKAARLLELAGLFLRLGATSFGGPASHIAMMEPEVVGKRRWLTRQQFLDLLGAANLIPGPSSTELAISVGYTRAGWMGLCVAGASFILPAALITGAFAWAYVRFGALPRAESVLGAIKAAVIAIIAIAVWRLGKAAVKDAGLAVLGAAALAAFLIGVNPVVILFGGGAVGMVARKARFWRSGKSLALWPGLLGRMNMNMATAAPLAYARFPPAENPTLVRIALFFLKVGTVLYGGGYVLLAFLEQGLVHQHGWLTREQLLDAVAIGQFTPGPVLSTATFIGYLLGGARGAAVATVAIFLPSFFYVGLLAPVLFRLRQSSWMAAFLDSVNVCAVALMIGVTFKLATEAFRGPPSWIIAAAALVILIRWKVNPAWIVFAAGIVGLLLR
ncbi:MAG TPA: chromate efflux transporter [Candidatus Solibacter sp.]|nr:chromate efflux transporter [Candidatus Solibacter sp.]